MAYSSVDHEHTLDTIAPGDERTRDKGEDA
jgi:hypothetical protein